MSGESARAAAHTRQAKAEQLLRDTAEFDRGAESGESTARLLGALSDEGWRVFHDVRWPGRGQVCIDHVLVGPSGVFVIDTKSWTGNVEVRGGALRQDGRRRARHVIASAAAAMAVGELIPGLSIKAIHPVICFEQEEPIFGWAGDVMICSTDNIVTFLTSRPRALDEAQMTHVAETLSISLDCASAKMPPPVAVYAGTDAASTDTRRRPPAPKSKRLPRAPIPEPVRVVALVGAVAVAAALAFQFDLPAKIGDLSTSAAQHVMMPTKPIGTTVSVPGLTNRPDLEVTAGQPRVTQSKLPGVQAMEGSQLVAVPVAVENVGDKVWNSTSDVSAEVTDSAGATYSSDPAYTSVRGGKALPATIKLPADGRTSGLIVFEVPEGAQVEKVRLKVGPGLPTTVRWSVD